MSRRSASPAIGGLEIPVDSWTAPFWELTANHRLCLPRCAACGTFRWPAGPFCPDCSDQKVEWCDAGEGQVFSCTVMPRSIDGNPAEEVTHIAALIEFPEAGSVRLLAAIVDAHPEEVEIGKRVSVDWLVAANAIVPVFRLISDPQE